MVLQSKCMRSKQNYLYIQCVQWKKKNKSGFIFYSFKHDHFSTNDCAWWYNVFICLFISVQFFFLLPLVLCLCLLRFIIYFIPSFFVRSNRFRSYTRVVDSFILLFFYALIVCVRIHLRSTQ